jgi:hypothetical protein
MTHADREREFQRLVLEVWACRHPDPERRNQASHDLERIKAGAEVRAMWRDKEPVRRQTENSPADSDGEMGERE